MKSLVKKKAALVMAMLGLMLSGAACTAGQPEPVQVTVWHVYGGQTASPLNAIIERFNQTVGREQGIYIQVTSVSNTNTIHEAVLASANQEPGAAVLPDLFISYPKTVLALPDEMILADYHDYFSEEELEAYIPSFLQEGTVHQRFVVFPVAKSTEIMFINQTAFDRYAAETGADMQDLRTWEGVFRMAEDYTRWSDAKTPDIPDDGKAFLAHDYPFNYFQVGVESLGESFFHGNTLAFGPAFDAVWEPYARAAVCGGVWLQEGYATEPLRTEDAVVSVGSSASVLYYADTVTYPDNASEKITWTAMPCPIFENGARMVYQRGAGFCLVKSSPEREQAAVTFLKWLTEPQNNVEFVTSLGYMPVTYSAFENYLEDAIEGLEDLKYRELYRAFSDTMREDYTFYTAPQIPAYLELETCFEDELRSRLDEAHGEYMQADGEEKEALLDSLIEETREKVKGSLSRF